jgi:hypothetical protein
MVGAAFESSDALRWRFAGTGVVSVTVMLSEYEESSLSRLSLLDLGLRGWLLPDIILLILEIEFAVDINVEKLTAYWYQSLGAWK